MQKIAHDLEEKLRTKDVLLEENVTFASLLLSAPIRSGLNDSGFKKPSPIQFKAIPLGRCGFDLIVKSKSGTGKTLVFSTAALEMVKIEKQHLQALILVPTREIAVQIQDVLRNIGRHLNGLVVESFIGGMPLEDDIKKAKVCHIAVGAPGRVKHLINLGALSTKFVRLFVLDEADKLMESTFQNDINEIYDTLPQRKQLIATSATYPKELDVFLSNYMLSPTHVTSENETPMLLGLKQFVSVLKANTINAVQQMKAKNQTLLDILSKVSFTQCLIFTNYQTRTETVCNFLNQEGWNSSFISAAVEQSERLEAIRNLKSFKSRILLSTDLTSRGIDAPNVDLVINYDLPYDAVTYLHRMGRAGRFGSSGICINFALEGAEIQKLQHILGTIGAANLSISKLPALQGVDLWQLDVSQLEQIWGVVSENANENSENIVKEVLMLKQKKQKSGKKKLKIEELEKSDCVSEILKKKESDIKEELVVDTDEFLSLLVNDTGYEEKKRKRGALRQNVKIEVTENSLKKENSENGNCSDATEHLLSNLISSFSSINSKEDSKKRKLNEPLKDHEKFPRKYTFLKNKALLNITRLLCNSSTEINSEIVSSLEEFLETKSNDIEDNNENSVEKILGCESKPLFEQTVDLENIFQLGYRSVLSKSSWLNTLPPEEVQSFQDFCRQKIVISDESEQEEVEDQEMVEDQVEVEEVQVVNTDSDLAALQWVPVERNEQATSGNDFDKHYETCSNVLWQTGLSFETVPEFDDWFYHWQEQLQSVRNYVQQNIYVEEMSNYQQSRRLNK